MGAKNLDVVITVIAVILVVLVWIMLYDSNRFVVRHYFLRDQRIKKPVKAVVLADLHNKRYGKIKAGIDRLRLFPTQLLVGSGINNNYIFRYSGQNTFRPKWQDQWGQQSMRKKNSGHLKSAANFSKRLPTNLNRTMGLSFCTGAG